MGRSSMEKRREQHRAYRQRNPRQAEGSRLKHRYGITLEQKEQMLADQGGLCAICRTAPAAHIDHNHGTGQVRSILCGPCNQALGLMSEDPARLRAAADYLAHWSHASAPLALPD